MATEQVITKDRRNWILLVVLGVLGMMVLVIGYLLWGMYVPQELFGGEVPVTEFVLDSNLATEDGQFLPANTVFLADDSSSAVLFGRLGDLSSQDGEIRGKTSFFSQNGQKKDVSMIFGRENLELFFSLQKHKTQELFPASASLDILTLRGSEIITQLGQFKGKILKFNVLLQLSSNDNTSRRREMDFVTQHLNCNQKLYQWISGNGDDLNCEPLVIQVAVVE